MVEQSGCVCVCTCDDEEGDQWGGVVRCGFAMVCSIETYKLSRGDSNLGCRGGGSNVPDTGG
eukprot:11704555-Ditylum_brightwellii.AAC.1